MTDITQNSDIKAKPHGPIPPGFFWRRGQMVIADTPVAELIADAQTPIFVYDFHLIAQKLAALRAQLPPMVHLHYAVKANPMPALLAAIAPLVDGFDVASAGEMARALAAGMAPDRISFAGPGKRDEELVQAIASGVTLNLESYGEAQRALAFARVMGRQARLAVRVNPDFSLKGSGMKMGGGAAPFGVDAEVVPQLVRDIVASGADWRGFHIFAGSQALDAEALIATQAATIALAGRLAEASGVVPPLVNLGGGFGIPYFPGERAVDSAAVGQALGQALDARPSSLADSAFAMELGRYLVGEAGVYLTRVVDRKISRGEVFLVVDGGLHHQLAASGNFGTVVRRNYPIALAMRTHAPDDARDEGGDPVTEVVSVVGCLCTPLDRLGDKVALPPAGVGDVIAVFLAGAYGATASPAAFLGHPPAGEILIGAGDRARHARTD